MALSYSVATRALNENATYRHGRFSNIAAYDFGDFDLTDCIHMTVSSINEMAVDYRDMDNRANEVLIEAALTGNTERFGILSESVFENLKKKVKEFFDKIIAFVKGLIVKIKARFFQFTRQTGEWVKLMKPKLEEKRGTSGMETIEREMYEWDTAYVTTGINSAFEQIEDHWKETIKKYLGNVASFTDELERRKKGATHAADVNRAVASGDDKDKENKEKAEDIIGADSNRHTFKFQAGVNMTSKEYNKESENYTKDYWKSVASALSVSGTDKEGVLTGIEKKAHGNNASKKMVKFSSKMMSWVEIIGNSKDTIGKIKEEYDKHLEHLTEFREKIDAIGGELEEAKEQTDKKVRGETSAVFADAYRSLFNLLIDVTRTNENGLGLIKDKAVSLVREMTNDFMNAGSQYLSYKPEKKS